MAIQIRLGEKTLEAEKGENLMELLRSQGLFQAPCGGNGTCGKCKVLLAPAPQASAEDRHFLSAQELAEGWRLACQTKVEENLSVTLPQTAGGARILTGGTLTEKANRHFSRRTVTIPAADLEHPLGDAERFAQVCGFPCPEALLPQLPRALREHNGQLTLLMEEDVLLSLWDTIPLGLAVDIGTTTMVAYLLNLEDGKQASVASCLNPQKAFGDDVISRISYASQDEEHLKHAQTVVIDALNRMIDQLLDQAGADRKALFHGVIVGNTTMVHLLLGITPEHIAAAPFIPAFTGAQKRMASALGLAMAPGAVVETLPNLSSYVGADILASVMASQMDEKQEITLLLDIGTNGEMALGNRDRMLACSTAAGPALEGAHIACGMGGVSGAIHKVELMEGLPHCQVLGREKARGICGSGIVDTVAMLLKSGVMDETGRLDEDEAPDGWEDFFTREGRNVSFALADGVFLSQKDIREVQLAKAAIAAGIRVLCQAWGIALEKVDRVCLAGGFGNYIDRDSACAIGLLPKALQDKIVSIGNGAGAGAQMALLNPEQFGRALRLPEKMRYLELSAVKAFQDLFVDEMSFE